MLSYRNNELFQRIFVRQGEDPDYLMRPVDAMTVSSEGINNPDGPGARPAAVKFTPYNLTAVTLNVQVYQYGTTTGGTTASKFTDYPTQTGAFWQWAPSGNIRVAWAPIGTITEWTINSSSGFWDTIGATHETCPYGYTLSDGTTKVNFRRPNDGLTNTVTQATVADSKTRQSLWLIPNAQTFGNANNSIWGYYADGFFERRQITDSPWGITQHSVAATSNNVANVGRVAYNPFIFNSLLFPASDVRNANNGELRLYMGSPAGYFWTSSRGDIGNLGADFTLNRSQLNSQFDASGYGQSIRCVKD